MPQPPDAPLTEEDAEAVLLAVADLLVWRDGNDFSVARTDRDNFYAALKRTSSIMEEWTAELCTSNKRFQAGISDSRDAAKAACERHHATGKWE